MSSSELMNSLHYITQSFRIGFFVKRVKTKMTYRYVTVSVRGLRLP